MLDDSTSETFYSLRALSQIAIERRKPLVLWVGAGSAAGAIFRVSIRRYLGVHGRKVPEPQDGSRTLGKVVHQ